MKRQKKFKESQHLVSSYFLSTTIRELNRGQPCIAFNELQINKLKEIFPNLIILPQAWYSIIKIINNNNEENRGATQ